VIRTHNPYTPGVAHDDGMLFEIRQNESWRNWMLLQHLTFCARRPVTGLRISRTIGWGNGASESMIVGESAFDGKIRMPGMSRSWIVTRKGIVVVRNKMRPIHPGEILREEYLVPLGMSANYLAKALNVTPARINDIVRERRGITADTALRLARYFGADARSWMNLQAAYDLRVAELAQSKRIFSTIRPRAA
jgi:antitoxin HigA-1